MAGTLLWLSIVLARVCRSSADFDFQVASSILKTLELELALPWTLVDFNAESVKSGLLLVGNTTELKEDTLQRFIFGGVKSASASVFMSYVARQETGNFYGYYNNGTWSMPEVQTKPYMAEISESNETCRALNHTSKLAPAWFRELSKEHGYSSGGHCMVARSIDQTTGVVIENIPGSDYIYDARIRPWYIEAVAAGRRTWSPIYVFPNSGFPVGITAARPLFSPSAQLVGVAGVDFVLDSIDSILTKFAPLNSTIVYILDGDTTLFVGCTVSGISTGQHYGGGLGQKDSLTCGIPVIEVRLSPQTTAHGKPT